MTQTSSGNYKIVATLMQLATSESTKMLRPTVTFSNLIPEHAEIWQCIKHDDVSGMRSLFKQRKASISDCDEYGESLLAVSRLPLSWLRLSMLTSVKQACRQLSADAVRFLVNHGLDVNELLRRKCYEGLISPTLD